MTTNDVAERAIRLLSDVLGRRVPEDVFVVGFHGTEVGEHMTPRLSSVRQPIYPAADL